MSLGRSEIDGKTEGTALIRFAGQFFSIFVRLA
jgi:hypothetical protein